MKENTAKRRLPDHRGQSDPGRRTRRVLLAKHFERQHDPRAAVPGYAGYRSLGCLGDDQHFVHLKLDFSAKLRVRLIRIGC